MSDPTRRGLLPCDRRLEHPFVDSQCRRQAAILAEQFSEDVCASDGHRGALAGERRHALARVTKKHDPTLAPARQIHLLHPVEVHVGGLLALSEDIRDDPSKVLIGLPKHRAR